MTTKWRILSSPRSPWPRWPDATAGAASTPAAIRPTRTERLARSPMGPLPSYTCRTALEDATPRRGARRENAGMAAYSVNPRAVQRAEQLIDARQYVLDSDWGNVQPGADGQNAFLKS